MSVLNPSGRLSKVEKGDQVFQIQTEFYHRPSPKITSAVIFNGKIMNKVDTPWEQKLVTDEDLKKIEKAIRRQHHRVTLMVENQKEDVKEIQPEEPPLTEPWKKLSEIKGIENLVVTDAQGKVLYMKTYSARAEAIRKIFDPANKLAKFLSQSTRLGDFLGGQIKLEKERIVWIYQKEQLWIAFLDQELDFDSFLDKAKKIEMEKKIE